MMRARRNVDGTITIPVAVTAPGVVGHGESTIGPGDPEYAMWDDWLAQHGDGPAGDGSGAAAVEPVGGL